MCPLKSNYRERVNGYHMKQTKSLTTPKRKQGTYFSASSTVEAALVIPLFLYASMAVIYILQIVAVKQRVQTALYEGARELAGYAYTYNRTLAEEDGLSNGVSKMAAWTFLMKELGADYGKKHYVVGGDAGFVMAMSQVCNNDAVIDLKVTYTIKNPFDLFGISYVVINQRCKTDAWLGEEKDAYGKTYKEKTKEEIVYVTEQGEVYHKDKNCTYLTRVIMQKKRSELGTLTNEAREKYEACSRCEAKNGGGDYVYVTLYGNRYHTDLTCSQLARTIIEIPVSKVGDRAPCQKCGGGG